MKISDYYDKAKFTSSIDKLAEQHYVKTGSPHTDHFAYWDFANQLVEPLLNEITKLKDQQTTALVELKDAKMELKYFRVSWPFEKGDNL